MGDGVTLRAEQVGGIDLTLSGNACTAKIHAALDPSQIKMTYVDSSCLKYAGKKNGERQTPLK